MLISEAEIRNQIYRIISNRIDIRRWLQEDFIPSVRLDYYAISRPLAILRVNPQIREEFFGIFSPRILFPEEEGPYLFVDHNEVCAIRAELCTRCRGQDEDNEDNKDDKDDENDEYGEDHDDGEEYRCSIGVNLVAKYESSEYHGNRNEEFSFYFHFGGPHDFDKQYIDPILATLRDIFAETQDFTLLNFLIAIDRILMMDFRPVVPSESIDYQCRTFEAIMLLREGASRISFSCKDRS